MRIRICRKEARESGYWLNLIDLSSTGALGQERQLLFEESQELMKIFGAILRNRTIKNPKFEVLNRNLRTRRRRSRTLRIRIWDFEFQICQTRTSVRFRPGCKSAFERADVFKSLLLQVLGRP